MALLCVYAISTILPCNEIMQYGSRFLFAIYVGLPHMQPTNTVHVHVVAQSSVGRLTALYEHLSLRLALKSICWSIKISPKCQVIFKCHKGMQYKSSNWKWPRLGHWPSLGQHLCFNHIGLDECETANVIHQSFYTLPTCYVDGLLLPNYSSVINKFHIRLF